MARAFVRFALPLTLVVLALLAIGLLPSVNWADDPPDDFPVTASNDMDGDGADDAIDAAPSGMDPESDDPGFVVVTASDGTSVLLTGREGGDFFGAAVAVAGDLNGDGFADLIVGAPQEKNGQGRAYVFYGPFRNYQNPQLSVEDADFIFESPDPNDTEFGGAVRQVNDIDCDGIPDVAIEAMAADGQGGQIQHSYIVSGATGDSLYLIVGNTPFDPWVELDGDAEGDGDVDQVDVDIVTRNQGRTGSLLTRRDGDFNSDAIVDGTDLAMAQSGIGNNHFTPIDNCGTGCPPELPPGFHCVQGCNGQPVLAPENVWPECRELVCQAWCGFQVDDLGAAILPITSYDDLYVYQAFGGLELHDVQWEVLQGAELIDIQSGDVGDSFDFYPRRQGIVQVRARNEVCTYLCEVTMPPRYLLFVDSDGDGLPDAWENEWNLDPYDPSDAYQDNDADGLNNLFEYAYGFNPFQPDAPGDTDGDGIPDNCEQQIGTDPQSPLDPPPGLDSDFDTIWDAYEHCVFGTDPFDMDSDGDGMPDGWEVQYGFSPVFDGDASQDPDLDGIKNMMECAYGSNPLVHNSVDPNGVDPALDTDGDWFIDWLELEYGSDPYNGASAPLFSEMNIDPADMSWMVVNDVVHAVNGTHIDMCEGDCFLLHAVGWASSWTVVQGQDLLNEVSPDSPDGCISAKWCITGSGDITIMSSTPAGGAPRIGFVHIHAKPQEECEPPCKLTITTPGGGEPPEFVCVGEELVLTATPDPANDPGCDCDGDYEWTAGDSVPGASEFVGNTNGPQVTLRITGPGEVFVSAKQGACQGGKVIMSPSLEVDFKKEYGIGMEFPTLETCPVNGGKRVFPGRRNFYDWPDEDNRKVTLKIRSTPAIAQVPVYIRIFDVDDPSSSTAPVDDNDSSGPTGSDNKVQWPGGYLDLNGATAGGSPEGVLGEASIDFYVSMQPGDNYKVFATICLDVRNSLTSAMAEGADPLPAGVIASPMLTVWRKLFIERDSMTPPTEVALTYMSTAPIAGVTANTPWPDLVTIDLGVNLPDDFSDEDLYEEGVMGLLGCSTTYPVYSNTSNFFDHDEVVVAVPGGTLAPCATTGGFTLRDDDVISVLPYYAQWGTVGTAVFNQAYVELEPEDSVYSDLVPFELNMTEIQFATGLAWDNGADTEAAEDYWVHLVVGGWQPGQNEDFDGDDSRLIMPFSTPSGAEFGATFAATRDVSWNGVEGTLIYIEVIRDYESQSQPPVVIEHIVVVHEILHGCGYGSHVPGTILDADPTLATMQLPPDVIHKIRDETIYEADYVSD